MQVYVLGIAQSQVMIRMRSIVSDVAYTVPIGGARVVVSDK